ncbi:MAG: DNA primase [Bacteroidota bacterium]
MIAKETISAIFDTVRIEEVVGDFVTLKKRGANYLGLCPFHNEKTPSFNVSPVKGIYKCFGCGKAGNSVNFIMEHEQMTYPEALRYLAKKYNIEIEEKEQTPEEKVQQDERESLYVISSFAQKHFTGNLLGTDEGRSIGLGYFRERGFRQDIIEKFQLGYAIDKWTAFTDAALGAGYQAEYLVKTGLSIRSEKKGEDQRERLFDRFSGRVMFPIHNVTGRVIGFGGRTLKTDKKVAKYVNSPESDIYHKSKVLYGLFFAKKSIIAEDNCLLVEGYTDVISLHQAGIENVVASSGTSLTTEQIRLIKRYTPNITILYDGDLAGIKASFRGIDMILEEGMNVRVLLFPDGDDPDSYSKKVSSAELKEFIKNNSKDFIAFKTDLLFSEAKNDPIRRAMLIKEIVESIALIPEAINRSVYIKECSRIMEMDEQVLLNELNKIRRKKFFDKAKSDERTDLDVPVPDHLVSPEKQVPVYTNDGIELDIIRQLLQNGQYKIYVQIDNEQDGNVVTENIEISVVEFILYEMEIDKLNLENAVYQKILEEVRRIVQIEQSGTSIDFNAHFINHEDEEIRKSAIEILFSPHSLHNWERHNIPVAREADNLKKSVLQSVYSLKLRRIEAMIGENQKKLKEKFDNRAEYDDLLADQKLLLDIKKFFGYDKLERNVLK